MKPACTFAFITGLAALLPGCGQPGVTPSDSVYGQSLQQTSPAGRTESTRQGTTRELAISESASSDQLSGAAQPRIAQSADELWVIPRDQVAVAAHRADRHAAETPSLRAIAEDGQRYPLPLERTDVLANIEGFIATVGVTQRYANPHDEIIEVEYVFPLPHDAAVTDFLMTIGNRTIRGVIREREEAKRLYEEARRQGYLASLMTEERPNIFTQRVANIEPDQQIDVNLTYFHTLAYSQGRFEWVFPTVVGPRYNPADQTNGIGSVGAGEQGNSGQPTEVTYQRPEVHSSPKCSLTVNLESPLPIRSVSSTSHIVHIDEVDDSPVRRRIQLADDGRSLDRDFILHFDVDVADTPGMMIASAPASGEGTFALLLAPRTRTTQNSQRPAEVIFVIDTSGSMEGANLASTISTVDAVLTQLELQDHFQIVRFSDRTASLGSRLLRAGQNEIAEARRFLDSLSANGGTEMIAGLNAVQSLTGEPGSDRLIILLTDALVSNDDQVFARTAYLSRDARVLVVGVGAAPNRSLIERLAQVGRGVTMYLTPNTSPDKIADDIVGIIRQPQLTDVQIDFGSARVRSIYPLEIPDLYEGRPVLIVGTYEGRPPKSVRLTGKRDGDPFVGSIECTPLAAPTRGSSLDRIWARAKITSLSDEFALQPTNSIQRDILETALRHGMSSAFTGFVAVDSLSRTHSNDPRRVRQPVSLPQDTPYEKTVRER